MDTSAVILKLWQQILDNDTAEMYLRLFPKNVEMYSMYRVK